MTVGNNTWFPAWQFDAGDLRPDLPEILTLLARFSSDPVASDRIRRIKREDLAGASISETLRRNKTEATAWQLLAALGCLGFPLAIGAC
ncbi:type II secretion system F family protein [Mycobacterium colombiense]|uniref:type II secretion system F family protein n=1 Tax=Mycobacterium colombiense TaxID=339268 RepID=UPI000B1F179F|nr:type II secretion system F family protein [Mycobacterium colombiense]